ncbi:MAG: flagellar biosynthesis protein FlhB [Treponema sp.]|nr:MAG: flagellar biosynthesis protein FlhB [Treponema sp.]
MDKKKIDCSVALSYTFDKNPPIIISKGKGLLAEQIREIASKNGIEIVKNSELAGLLSEQEIGACIPVETYEAIAGIFAFLEKTAKT